MKKLFFYATCIFICLYLSACSDDDSTDDNNSENFEPNSQDITIENAISIAFDTNNAVSVTNPYTESVRVENLDGHVTITSTVQDTTVNYVLSGSINEGSLKIYSDYEFGLVLNGVSIISSDRPAINIQSSKKVSLSLIDNTNNRLIDGTTYIERETEDMEAALSSRGQLVFTGNGSLYIIGRNKHAIWSRDYIRIDEGNILIKDAVKDGIHTKEYFVMNGGRLSIASQNDGIESEKGYVLIKEGNLDIKSESGDGIKTSYKGSDSSIVPYVDIKGGKVDIQILGVATRGINSKSNVNMSGGNIVITSAGDAYYDETDLDVSSSSAIKARGDMHISGDCTLDINSSGLGGKGINVDGELVFGGGITSVTTTGDKFIHVSDSTVAKAIKSNGNLTINSGEIKIKTFTDGAEGLESKATLTINGGNVEIEAFDDGINASDHIEITGGTVYCNSATNDAIDSNGTLTVTGGIVVAVGSEAPETGFDCDNKTFKITGGTLVGIGGRTSIPTSDACTQNSLLYGTSDVYELIHISSATNKNVVTFKVPKSLSPSALLVSSPDMKAGEDYTIYTGGSFSGGEDYHGLQIGATYTGGTLVSTFTTSSMLTTIGTIEVPEGAK